ncbi:uncharacterized protein LOC114306273 [Camellia sinensis]|uniref:uncharacterized protein LOC114306273 n=1 Tax=Camellia sinensis TaxID=4442 RepID=UPI001035D58E|nr:uncharacterized protein LOC114306273 [Camellia sinensis]
MDATDNRQPTQRERIELLEQHMDSMETMATSLATLEQRVYDLEQTHGPTQGQDFEDVVTELRLEIEGLSGRVGVLTHAFGNAPSGGMEFTRARVLEPRAYCGTQDAKELDNFLFDMEQYFKAVKADAEETGISMATMYLSGDAKLWWRTKHDEMQRGLCTIETWGQLKHELKLQFFLENIEYNARRALRDLKHTDTIRDYVKEFSRLMLDMKDMSVKDKLFFFLEGLKPWARVELQRQRVQDLAHAQAAGQWQRKSYGDKAKAPQQFSTSKAKGLISCFLCNGPHRLSECPQKRALNALATVSDHVSQPSDDSEEEDVRSRRSGKGSKTAGFRVGAFHMMNAMEKKASIGRPKKNAKSGKVGKHSDPKQLVESNDEGKGKKPMYSRESSGKLNKSKSSNKGLMFVDVKLNGKPLRALIDTGATHNFVARTEVESLRLSLEKDGNCIKAVNSAAQPIYRVAKSIHLKVSTWEGRVDFTVVPIDDFQAILGLDFLRSTKTAVMPYSNSICVMEDKPCLIPAMATNNSDRFVSTMQLKRGVRHGEQTWVAALKLNEALESTLVPATIKKVLRQFVDVMPEQLPKELSPRRAYRVIRSRLHQPSKAPFGAHVLFQKKYDGRLRLCVDYRALNKLTIKNKYPLPLIANSFDQLSKARYFTKLDLQSGYYQVRIVEGDEPKTISVTCYGSYEFLIMPFGLTNAPATFCTMMNEVFQEYLDQFVVVYLDDIVIYNSTLEEHMEYLHKALTKLREHKLYVKLEKCSFAQERIKFLGHIVEQGCIKMDQEKVKAIQEWQPPTNVSELRSFLRLANYYRKFVEGYSRLAFPLTELLKKGKPYVWAEECQQAFQALKEVMSKDPVLALPDLGKAFDIQTDASDFALGGVLLQDGHPIAYESRKLNDVERRYPVHEKELLAVLNCLRTWSHYILGSRLKEKIKAHLNKDAMAENLMNLFKMGKTRQFWVQDGLLMTTDNCIFVPRAGDLRKTFLRECHDTLWAGHPGWERTLALVKQGYYWPQMRDDVEEYVRTCLTCQQDKVEHKKKAGLLEPLPVPKHPWESVSLDFITGLPKVGDIETILTIVDRFSKYATFVAAPKYVSAGETA